MTSFKKFPDMPDKRKREYSYALPRFTEWLRRIRQWRVGRAKKLEAFYKRVHDKHCFESEHTQLDRESGYVVSKPQQELVKVLAWIDEQLKELLETLK